MTERYYVHTAGDVFLTMGTNGVVHGWEVDEDGYLHEKNPYVTTLQHENRMPRWPRKPSRIDAGEQPGQQVERRVNPNPSGTGLPADGEAG